MKSPVLFIIFKREDTAKRVFSQIRQAKPPRLYVAADGPRPGRLDDEEGCARTRKIIEGVDWDCEVKTLFQSSNLGCAKGVSTAITWFFENEPEGIIVEDDIFAHPDFFTYCDEMLERYRDDARVQLIAGHNCFYRGDYPSDVSYYMSSFLQIWGWASWRRVWQTYELDAAKLPRDTFLQKLKERFPQSGYKYYLRAYNRMCAHKIDTWDYQFFFNQILYDRYSVIPFVNQVENLGLVSADATHSMPRAYLITKHKAASPYPLKHPHTFNIDKKADYVYMKVSQSELPNLFMRVIRKIREIMKL